MTNYQLLQGLIFIMVLPLAVAEYGIIAILIQKAIDEWYRK